MPNRSINYGALYQAGVDYVHNEDQRQIQAEADFAKWQKEEEEFVLKQQKLEMDRQTVEEIADVVMNDKYSDAEANKKLLGIRMRAAMRDTDDPLGSANKVLEEYMESEKDYAVLGQERQKLKQQLTDSGYKTRQERASAEQQEADADLARKKADTFDPDKKKDERTAAQKNIEAEAKARKMEIGELYEERAAKKKKKVEITEDDFVDSKSRVKKIVGEYGSTTMKAGDIEDLANQHSKITAQLQEEYEMSEYEAKREADRIVMEDMTDVVEDDTWGGVGKMRVRKYSVKTPDGKEYKFKNQKQADEFKRKAGL